MQPHKLKASETPIGKPVQFRGFEGLVFTLQTVYYSSEDPSKYLTIYDSDGDMVSFPMPGQVDPKPIDIGPVSVKLPIKIVDEAGGNTVIIRGTLTKNKID